MRAIITALAAASILSIASVHPASLLVVSVGEAGTGAFIKDAEVRLVEAKRLARTAWDGEARFSGLTSGRVHVQVRAIGFAPGDVDVQVSGDSSAVHFELERSSVALDTVRVNEVPKIRATLQEFETRRKQNIGRFLTDSMLLEDRTQSLQYVLATRFPGIQVHEHGIRSMQPSGLGADSECPVLIYMDGFKITDVDKGPNISPAAQRLAGGGSRADGGGGGRADGGGGGRGAGGKPPREITPLDQIRPDSLIGVEYYSRTSAPVQYKPLGNYCKVILLWTRR